MKRLNQLCQCLCSSAGSLFITVLHIDILLSPSKYSVQSNLHTCTVSSTFTDLNAIYICLLSGYSALSSLERLHDLHSFVHSCFQTLHYSSLLKLKTVLCLLLLKLNSILTCLKTHSSPSLPFMPTNGNALQLARYNTFYYNFTNI